MGYKWLSLFQMTCKVFMWVQVRHLSCQHGWESLGCGWKCTFDFTSISFKFGLLLYVIFIWSVVMADFLVINSSPSNFFRMCRRFGFLGLQLVITLMLLSCNFFVDGLSRDSLSMFLTCSITSFRRVVGYFLCFTWLYIF